jgi:ribosomal protein L39E
MILIIDMNSKSDKDRLYKELKRCKLVPYRVELKEDRDNRSNNQNRYYWAVVIKTLSDETGFTPEEMHEVLKRKFLKYNKVLPNGEQVGITMSTTDLDTKEFEEYMEQIRRFAIQELDILILLPNEIIEI